MNDDVYVVESEWLKKTWLVGVCLDPTVAFELVSQYVNIGNVPNRLPPWSYKLSWSVLSSGDEISYGSRMSARIFQGIIDGDDCEAVMVYVVASENDEVLKTVFVRRIRTNEMLVVSGEHWLD